MTRISNPVIQSLMPSHNTLKRSYSRTLSADRLLRIFLNVVGTTDGLQLQTSDATTTQAFIEVTASAPRDTWSRAARRRKLQLNSQDHDTMDVEPDNPLICLIRITGSGEDSTAGLEFQWIRGKDRALFESFASHAGRKVAVGLIE